MWEDFEGFGGVSFGNIGEKGVLLSKILCLCATVCGNWDFFQEIFRVLWWCSGGIWSLFWENLSVFQVYSCGIPQI